MTVSEEQLTLRVEAPDVVLEVVDVQGSRFECGTANSARICNGALLIQKAGANVEMFAAGQWSHVRLSRAAGAK